MSNLKLTYSKMLSLLATSQRARQEPKPSAGNNADLDTLGKLKSLRLVITINVQKYK